MSSRAFNIVVVATIVFVMWSVWLAAQSKNVVIEFIRGQSLVQDIDTTRLTKIEITKGGKPLVLQRVASGFLVNDSYPADGGRINNLIQQCTGITCGREIADNTDVHEELEVDGKSENSVVVRFVGGTEEIVGLIVGKMEGSANYVRLTNSDTVFISENSIFVDTDALAYVDKELISVVNTEKVEVSGGKKPYTILKAGTEDGVLQAVPEGMAAKSMEVRNVFTLTHTISFSEFSSESTLKGVEFNRTYAITTESKEQYIFTLGQKGSDWWVKATAKYVGPATLSVGEIKNADAEQLKKHEALLQAGAKVKKFADRHRSWVYKVSENKGKEFTREFDDLIEEDKVFLRIEEKAIGSVSVKRADGSYTLTSPNEGVFKMKDLPKDKEMRPFLPSGIYAATTSLAWIERIDPEEKLVKDVKYETKYTTELKDKASFTFDIGKKENRFFTKVNAAFVGGPKDNSPESVIAEGAVAKFNKLHKGHVYEIPVPGAVDNMVKSLKDLLKDASEELKEIAASHILVSFKGSAKSMSERSKEDAKKKADELLVKAKADPGNFAKLAEENSDGPSKAKGGDLGKFDRNTMAPPFTVAAFKLKVGEVSDVVETEFGFHIIRRTQ